jgi:hypothetical protein
MRNPTTTSCAVPAKFWNADVAATGAVGQLGGLFREAATLERRISKGVNLDEEQSRYAAVCEDLEGSVLGMLFPISDRRTFQYALDRQGFPALRIGPAHFDLLAALLRQNHPIGFRDPQRVGATILPPNTVAEHRQAYLQLAKSAGFADEPAIRDRGQFLALAAKANCGVLELPNPLDDAEALPRVNGLVQPRIGTWTARKRQFRAWLRRYTLVDWFARQFQPSANPVSLNRADWLLYGTDTTKDRGEFMKQRLRSQIEQALAGVGCVNMSGQQRHETATEVLQEFVVQKRGQQPGEARILYADGSEAAPFPLRCVAPSRSNWKPTRELHVALMSMRHLQLDREIDINWLRNASVPADKTMADADDYCFQTSLRQLKELHTLYAQDRLLLVLYHTGFEPAVIGFYRALVTLIRDTSTWTDRVLLRPNAADWIRVLPQFVRGDHFASAARWPE